MSHPKRIRQRRLRLETLERRFAMSGDSGDWENSLPWLDAANLTISFAPDGTRIGSHPSDLFSTLGESTPQTWQNAILASFQTWARQSQINVGLVTDDGSPFGTVAVAHGDDRFGDVRIGAVPMSPDTMAVAIPHDRQAAGSWAGDILFNSDATFDSVDEIAAVALHEIGHVLGLNHSPDPQSPMYETLGSQPSPPTEADLSALQALYGLRRPDPSEGSGGNETINKATPIKFADEVEEGEPLYDGSTPLVVYADILNSSDRDVFQWKSLAGYTGPATITLRTTEFSQLAPKLSLYSATGEVLAQGAGNPGEDVELHLPAVVDSSYFLQIEGATTDQFDTGAYALVITFDALLQVSPTRIDNVVRHGRRIAGFNEHGIDEADLRRMFEQPSGLPILDDDHHQDDDSASAVDLEPYSDSGSFLNYRVIGSLTDAVDVDTYRLKSPAQPKDNSHVLLVNLQSLDVDGLIGEVEIVDEDSQPVPVTVLANGLGHYLVQATNLASDRHYEIRVRKQGPANFELGNYELDITFSRTAVVPVTFAEGILDATQNQRDHTLYVARSQLFSLALKSSGTSQAIIWATVYAADQRPVHLIAGPAEETRSAASVLLDPGEYTIQVVAQGQTGEQTVSYMLFGERLSDPIGPPVTDPTATPIYTCPDTSGVYCYPGSVTTPIPILVTPATTPKIPFPATVVTPPLDYWYWQMDYLNTNPKSPLDVSNDQSVSPIDALMIINDLNAHGSRSVPPPPIQTGYLDVNDDGYITPLDVLLVINYLNQNSLPASAEGEARALASLAASPRRRALADSALLQLLAE